MYDIASLFTTTSYVTIIVEFALGFAFGYYLRKFVKAILGLLILGFIGVALNYAQFVALSNAVTEQLNVTPQQFMSVVSAVLPFLAITVIAPLTIGLIIGFLIGG